jgi:hypothetical protein
VPSTNQRLLAYCTDFYPHISNGTIKVLHLIFCRPYRSSIDSVEVTFVRYKLKYRIIAMFIMNDLQTTFYTRYYSVLTIHLPNSTRLDPSPPNPKVKKMFAQWPSSTLHCETYYLKKRGVFLRSLTRQLSHALKTWIRLTISCIRHVVVTD